MEELAAYFYNHVFLAYDEYVTVKHDGEMFNGRDRRVSLNAATALYHLREHVPHDLRKSRAALAKQCPDYDLLGDIVNAAKHNNLTLGQPQVISSEKIVEVLVCTTLSDQDGEYAHHEKAVEVELVDGSTRDLYDVLTNAVNMWLNELHRIGAIDQREPLRMRRIFPISRDDAVSASLGLTKGYRWQQRFRMQRYDADSGEVVPVDLSSYEKLTFTIKKPPTFTIELNDASGVQTSSELQLTAEQASTLKKIGDPDRRREYLLQVAQKQGLLEQMLAEYLKTSLPSET